MGLSMCLKLSVVLASVALLSGCGVPDLNKVNPETISVFSKCSRTSVLPSSEPAEKSYCTPKTITGSSVNLTGAANYQALTYNTSGAFNGLSDISPNRPIRFAEVEVLDSSGNLVQCGHTDANGQFSLSVPTSSSTHTIKVNSRGNNAQINTSVKMCPEENIFYSVSTTSTLTQDTAVSLPVAAVNDNELSGGAFNIYDQIVKANEFLRSQVGSACPAPYTDCTVFTVAPKVDVYWEKGFNPNAYFGAYNSGSSFYLKGHKRLFLLGGINGNTDHEDTDHFDNSVILHEYAHFLEDVYSKSDSPGGAHSANAVIDPRLAWSEGFANFFQAAVTGEHYYIDTAGNFNGTANGFKIDLENQTGGYIDKPLNPSEGNFREFSITRFLIDLIDTASDGTIPNRDLASNDFPKIWGIFTSATKGFRKPNVAFRSIGLFHYFSDTEPDWENPILMAQQERSRSEYAFHVAKDTLGACSLSGAGPYQITPSTQSRFDDDQGKTLNDGSFNKSHLLLNNQFFHYNHTGGAFDLNLKHQPSSPSGTVANLQLLVFKELHNYSVESGTNSSLLNNLITKEGQVSTPNHTLNDPSISYTVNFNRANLNAGHYLIAVRAYASGPQIGTETNFELKLGANDLCTAAY